MTLDDYLRHPGLSAGSISRYVAGACDVWKYDRDHGTDVEVNDDNLGTIVHAMVLEGKDPSEICRVWTGGLTKTGKPTTNKNSDAYHEFVEAARADGMMVCDESTIKTATDMRGALSLCDQAAPFLFDMPGEPEVDMLWTERGHPAKARADRLLRGHRMCVELKTTFATTLEQHRKQAFDLGYHHKADWYRRAYIGTTGEHLAAFVFVSVSKIPPYPVWVWSVDPRAEVVAAAEIDWALDDIAKRMESGDWRQETSKQVSILQMPPWKISDIGRKALEGT